MLDDVIEKVHWVVCHQKVHPRIEFWNCNMVHTIDNIIVGDDNYDDDDDSNYDSDGSDESSAEFYDEKDIEFNENAPPSAPGGNIAEVNVLENQNHVEEQKS